MSSNALGKRAFTVDEFCKAYSISRGFAYLQMKSGALRSVKIGAKRLIPTDAAEAWLSGLAVA